MATTTITSKGQTTIPKAIRDLLRLKAGDRLDFVVEADGRVYVQPVNIDVRQLSGMLYKKGRKSVSLAQMDEAIAMSAGESA